MEMILICNLYEKVVNLVSEVSGFITSEKEGYISPRSANDTLPPPPITT